MKQREDKWYRVIQHHIGLKSDFLLKTVCIHVNDHLFVWQIIPQVQWMWFPTGIHTLVEYSKLIKSTSACLSQMKLRIPQWNRYHFDINARKVQNTNFQKQRNVLKGNLHLDNAKRYYILYFKKLFCNWKYVQENEQQMNVQIKP